MARSEWVSTTGKSQLPGVEAGTRRVSAVSFLLLAETRRALGGEKPGMDGVPSSDSGGRVGEGLGLGSRGRRNWPSVQRGRIDRAQGRTPKRVEPLAKRIGRARSHGYTAFKNHSV